MIDRVAYDWAPLIGLIAVVAFAIDWTLTRIGAAASKKVRDRWATEGSYEMNPTWHAQVDSGRWLMLTLAEEARTSSAATVAASTIP